MVSFNLLLNCALTVGSDLDAGSGSDSGCRLDGPASCPRLSYWWSMRSSPSRFPTLLLKSISIRSIVGASTTSGFFMHWSYNLALVTTSLANPTKLKNFLEMVYAFSRSALAWTFSSKLLLLAPPPPSPSRPGPPPVSASRRSP